MAVVFSLSEWVMLLIFAAFGVLCLLAALGFLSFFRMRAEGRPQRVPVTTFLSAITTAWALSLGFAAADVWSMRANAEQAASEERSAIGRLAGMASRDALGLDELMEAVAGYKAAVVVHEWIGGANADPLPEVDEAVQNIRLAIVDAVKSDQPSPLITKMINDFDELQDARNKRLAIGGSSMGEYKWYLVLFLTFLSMVAIAAVHADRPIGGRNALGVYTVAAVVSLWILALYANPYTGLTRIDLDSVNVPVGLAS